MVFNKKNKNQIYKKTFDFSVNIINLYRNLKKNGNEFELYTQLLKSGTSIGANIAEGLEGQSKKDFISKFSIALKEAAETEYWLDLFLESKIIVKSDYEKLKNDIRVIIKILSKIIKSSKSNFKGDNNE